MVRDMAEKSASEIAASYLVPATAAEEMADGPFPLNSSVTPAALRAFAARLAEDAEKPLQVSVLEDKDQSQFVSGRLRRGPLQHVGQAVEFEAPDAEGGAIRAAVLLNISTVFDVSNAKWKLIYVEEVPAPG